MSFAEFLRIPFLTENLWCLLLEDTNIWIITSYIPEKESYDADAESRKKQTKMEWMVNPKKFTKIISKFQFQPKVDLIASRINAKLLVFVSYHSDPEQKQPPEVLFIKKCS